MSKYQTKKSEGFTIIEVLIVLAIAGLIMLVVFLAVPNLQRNSRNNGYRSEASSILAAYSEVSSNKNGAILSPSSSAVATSDAGKVKAASNPQNISTIIIEVEAGSTGPALDQAVIRTGAKCTSPDPASATTATDPGSARQISILYMVETPGSTIMQCLSS